MKRLLPDAVRSDFDTFTLQRGYQFPQGASGPFGEQMYGLWEQGRNRAEI